MNSERRRAIFERVRDRAIQIGNPMDDDPLFVGWVEEWIAGEIEIDELKRRYGELLSGRQQLRRGLNRI